MTMCFFSYANAPKEEANFCIRLYIFTRFLFIYWFIDFLWSLNNIQLSNTKQTENVVKS